MFQVSQEDVLRGLKRFKRLAKQDLLASGKTPNPQFWTEQAEARRRTYDQLMTSIEQDGLEAAYQMARRTYATLPVIADADAVHHPAVKGQEQALELFFSLLGLAPEQTEALRRERQLGSGVAYDGADGSSSVAVNSRS